MQEERNGITLTILQEKGGCGKSCAIFNIADYLSKKKNVLIIDLDGQAADISYLETKWETARTRCVLTLRQSCIYSGEQTRRT